MGYSSHSGSLKLAAAAIVSFFWLPVAFADGPFPERPVTLVTPFPPGGLADAIARSLSERLNARWKVPVVVENRPGAGGNIGAGAVAKAPADGYTLLLAVPEALVIAKAAQMNVGFDPENDLAPVAMPSLSPTVLVVGLASPFNTLEQLLAEARRRPGQINFGTNGVGSSYHLALERLKAGAKVDIQHVPYKDSAQLMPDLLSGRIDATIVTAFLADQQVKAGRVRAIATTSRERSRLFPSLPTVAESGLAAYDVPVALTVFAPGRTPKAILDRINSDILAIMREPAMVSMLERQGTVTTELRPDQLRVKMRDDVRDLEQLISAQGLKLAE